MKLIDNTLFCKKKEKSRLKVFLKSDVIKSWKNCDVHCQFLGADFPRSLHPFLTRSTNIDRKNEQIVSLGVTTSFSNKIHEN